MHTLIDALLKAVPAVLADMVRILTLVLFLLTKFQSLLVVEVPKMAAFLSNKRFLLLLLSRVRVVRVVGVILEQLPARLLLDRTDHWTSYLRRLLALLTRVDLGAEGCAIVLRDWMRLCP